MSFISTKQFLGNVFYTRYKTRMWLLYIIQCYTLSKVCELILNENKLLHLFSL